MVRDDERKMLPEEEQQEYVDNGGVLAIRGTNDSYARQRRNGNRKPVKPAGDAAGTTADTKGSTGADRYQAILETAKRYNQMADDEEGSFSEEDRKKIEKAAKRRMLLAGIADAANTWHQAYAYARGIKPMNEGRDYTKEAKKELREDEDWYNKNKDRILNYRAKAAELEKTVAGLENADRQYEERISKERRAQRESDAKIKAYEARANKDEGLANLYLAKAEAIKNGDVNKERECDAKIRVYESQVDKNNASANASNALADQRRNGTVVEEEKTDEVGLTSKSKRRTRPLTNTNGGTSNSGKRPNPMGSNKKTNPMN